MAPSLLRDNIIGLWVCFYIIFTGNKLNKFVNMHQLVTLLYGIHIVVFIICIYVILSRWRQSRFVIGLLIVSTLIFMCATIQMVCTILVAVLTTDLSGSISVRSQIFFKFMDGAHSQILAMADAQTLLNQKNFANLMICIEYTVTTVNVLLTDGLLIWRCYMLWSRRWQVVVIPIMLLLAGSGLAFDVVAIAVKMYLIRYRAPVSAPLPLPGWDDLGAQVWPLSGASYTAYFVDNVIITTLIGYGSLLDA
ncbi:hypothetical protein NEOLEDRAFT_1178043 [Neolentinus lepideus HHB14362 ss-1]|uniref:Uncharacterized protein n=1 Tax=Neolentinus lepideus HHB14362 ss-1 TaxID=1314782 RepID=A0A165SZM8_9AGAM|nr:hypothetical protein NEOLEDRAFT_1178043 [Neolentinus lepideus HHB14362 ss-1]